MTGRLGALRWVELDASRSAVRGRPTRHRATRRDRATLRSGCSGTRSRPIMPGAAELVGSRLSIAARLPADAATVGSAGAQALVEALTTSDRQLSPPRHRRSCRAPRLVGADRSLAVTSTPVRDEPVPASPGSLMPTCSTTGNGLWRSLDRRDARRSSRRTLPRPLRGRLGSGAGPARLAGFRLAL